MTKKHLLFALIVCMSTVWRFLELLEYGEIEVRQVDTYMYFYMLATCFVSFLVGKESAIMSGSVLWHSTLPIAVTPVF